MRTAILFLAAAAVLTAGDAQTFRFDAGNTGATAELIPPAAGPSPLTPLWTAQLPFAELRSSPAVVGSRVFVGGEDGALRCLDLATGAPVWTFSSGGPIRSTPAYFKGRVYVGSMDGTLYVLHAGTGAVLWSVYHGGSTLGSATVATIPGPVDAVFVGVGSRSYEIRAYDAIDGGFLWAYDTGQPVTSTPAFHAGVTPKLIVGNNVGIWTAIDATTGAPLWTYTAPEGQTYVSAAIDGDRVIFCSGMADRKLHVFDAETGTLIKEMTVAPPGFGKVGGSAAGDTTPFHPETFFDADTLHGLLNTLEKSERDVVIDAWAATKGFDAAKTKEWFDRQVDSVNPSLQSPGGPFWIDLNRSAQSSSPAVSNGVAVITARELSGTNLDEYYTVAFDVTAAVPAASSKLWGTSPLTERWMDGRVLPSPAISAGTYAFFAHTRTLHMVNLSDGSTLGSVDVGEYILGGPTLANGRVLVTTMGGKVICYASGNNPPSAPTAFNPSGGTNVTATDMPTLFWSGQADPESAPGALSSRLEFAYGWANGDLETTLDKTTIALPAGASSYQIVPPIPPNTHVFWRVRVEDPNGAQSGWSPIQDFWINQDQDPPLPPGNVAATPGDSQVTVSWTASPSPDVERYRLRYKLSTDSWATATLVDNIPAAATSQLVGGLTNGFSYDFALVAVDFGENESAAAIVSATPQASITIGGGGPGFATIQDALNAAGPGQTVVLQPGTYVESVIVPPGVGLMGQSASNTILDGGGAPVVIQVNGTYGVDPVAEIAYLTITNGGIGIDAGNADVYVHHVVMHTLSSDAIVGSAGGRLRVEFATISGNGGDGISGTSPITSVSGCILEQNGGFGADLPPAATVSYTDFYLNALGPLGGPVVETGNLSLMPVFIDAAFHVQDGSVTVDKGDPAMPVTQEPSPNGGRVNMGAYGDTPEAALTVGGGFTGGPSGGTVGTTPGSSPGGGGGGGGGGCGLSSVGVMPSWLSLWVLAIVALGLGRRR